MSKNRTPADARPATRLVRAGRSRDLTGPFINPPVVRASTVLYDSADDMQHARQKYHYGRRGTPTSEALEQAICDLEGSEGVVLLPSGLAAATVALLSCLSAGDDLLLTDTVYGPVRHFADTALKRLGITTRYYDPGVGAGIEALFTPKTRAVYTEIPGSVTFEMQDLPAIAAVAKRHGAIVLCDNTWATPLYFRALEHGADLSIIAGTKYLGGHADVMIGTVAANGEVWKNLKELYGTMGLFTGPDDMFLALRGTRTLAIRLERHQQSAMTVAKWLAARPEIARVLYPPLPTDPGHALWRRDMTGASGLFGVVFNGWSDKQAMQFMDHLVLFGIGASWGGYESLITFQRPRNMRTAVPWQAEGPLVRMHIGLEDPADLIADIEASLAAVAATD
jgi:cystathionine beta-lyase